MIQIQDGRLTLLPAASHDIEGGPDPSTWAYTLTVGGPGETMTYSNVSRSGVLHIQYSRDPETPWRGAGPLQVAQLAGRLSAETCAHLADEAGGPRGSFLPIPTDGQDTTIGALKGDIKGANGALLLTEGGDWSQAGQASADWAPRRFGATPPAGLVELLMRSSYEIWAACGFSPSLFDLGTGTGSREAYRQALFSVISPLGRLVESELRERLEADIKITWGELRASDVAGRARAFASLVQGGMDMGAAAAASGVLIKDEG